MKVCRSEDGGPHVQSPKDDLQPDEGQNVRLSQSGEAGHCDQVGGGDADLNLNDGVCME